jgi:DNA polymerase-4
VDISDLPQSSELIARQIQQQILTETGLPCSIGAATSKLVAKIATDAGKSESRTGRAPSAIKVVPPGKELEFLAPLPVRAIWGVGPKMAARLNEVGIQQIKDIQMLNLAELKTLLGNAAGYLHDASQGIDPSQVVVEHGIKSISQETTFGEDIIDIQELEKTLRWLTEKVARRLREKQLYGNTVRVKIRLKDFSTYTRQVQLDTPTDVESIILQNALNLFNGFHRAGHQVRLLGVGVSGLGESWHQMGLWESKTEKEIRLHAAVDTLQQRFGKQSIQRGKTKHDRS